MVITPPNFDQNFSNFLKLSHKFDSRLFLGFKTRGITWTTLNKSIPKNSLSREIKNYISLGYNLKSLSRDFPI